MSIWDNHPQYMLVLMQTAYAQLVNKPHDKCTIVCETVIDAEELAAAFIAAYPRSVYSTLNKKNLIFISHNTHPNLDGYNGA